MAWYNFFSKFAKQSEELNTISQLVSEDEYRSIAEEEERIERAEARLLTLDNINTNDPISFEVMEAIRDQMQIQYEDERWIQDNEFNDAIQVVEEIQFEGEEVEETEEERIQRELDDAIDELEYASGEVSAALIKYMYKEIQALKEKQTKHEDQIHSLEEQLASIEFYKE